MSSNSELTLRPSWRKYGQSVLRRFSLLVILAAGLQFWLAGQVGGRDSVFGSLALGLIVFVVVVDIGYRMSTVIRVTPVRVVIEAMRFLRRDVPRANVAGVALRGIPSYTGAKLYAVIFDDHHRSVATLPEGIWDEDDLRRLQAALGAKNDSIQYATSGELAAAFPGALSVERYLGWGLALVVIALIFVGAAVGR